MTRRLILILLLFAVQPGFAQLSKTVKLKATSGKIRLEHYSINKVTDDRADTAGIGFMRSGIGNRKAGVVLENGTAAAITGFIAGNTLQPVNDPVELHILKLQVSESGSAFREQADLTVQFGFYRNGQKIIDYSGTSSAKSGADVSPYIGKLVSQSIENVLKEFDSWWKSNRHLYDESKKDQLSVTTVLKEEGTDPDQIVFNRQKPLQITDFGARPDDLSIALAVTYSGLAIQYEVQSGYDGTRVKIDIAPYFDKTKSWMKKAGKNAYVLQHEQLHFDITAIKAYELATAIKNYTFTAANLKEEISALHKKYSKETEDMQAQYDKETAHGTLKSKQQLWEARILAELKEQAAAAGY